MKVRTKTSNLTTLKEIAKEEDCPKYDEDDENVDPHDEGQNEEETRENVDSSEESLTKVAETSTKRTTEEPEEKNDTEILKRKSTVGSGKVKSKVSKREKSEIEEEELNKALEIINKLVSAEENKGECEIFGELLATELKALSQKLFLMAKYEIQNVLFKVRMEALEADLNDRPTEERRTATTNIQHLSTSTPVSLPIETPYQSTTQPQMQPFQPYNSNNFDINSLVLFMAQVQDAASCNTNS